MNSNLKKAKELLSSEGFTCVLVKDETVYTSSDRGVKPLLNLIDNCTDVKNFSAADKVVGDGAANLYVLLGVSDVFAEVISEPAMKTLEGHGISVEYNTCVKNIVNRTGTGICPMEDAVKNADSPEDALRLIREKLASMKN